MTSAEQAGQDAHIRARIEGAADTMPETPVRWGRVTMLARRKALLGALAALVLGAVLAALLVFGGSAVLLHSGAGSPIPVPFVGVPVPDVTGMSEAEAKAELEHEGLKGVVAASCPSERTCLVGDTRPEHGSNVLSGAVVKLYLSPHGRLTHTTSFVRAASIELELLPAYIAADGRSTTTARATVLDGDGHPLAGQAVELVRGGQTIAARETEYGVYTYGLTSSTRPGTVTIVAKDGSIAGSAYLHQFAGEVESEVGSIEPSPLRSEVLDSGSSHVTVTVKVFNKRGQPDPGQKIELLPNVEGVRAGPVSESAVRGVYTATITCSTRAETVTIVVKDRKIFGQITLIQTPGAPERVELLLAPTEKVASGSYTTTAKAKAFDKYGNLLRHQTVEFLAMPTGGAAGKTAESEKYTGVEGEDEDGVYTAVITGFKGARTVIVTAKDAGASAAESFEEAPAHEETKGGG